MSALDRMAKSVRDCTSGIAGRVTAVCHNEHEDTQYRIRRYGVDSYGKPFDQVWAYVKDCVDVSDEEARA